MVAFNQAVSYFGMRNQAGPHLQKIHAVAASTEAGSSAGAGRLVTSDANL